MTSGLGAEYLIDLERTSEPHAEAKKQGQAETDFRYARSVMIGEQTTCHERSSLPMQRGIDRTVRSFRNPERTLTCHPRARGNSGSRRSRLAALTRSFLGKQESLELPRAALLDQGIPGRPLLPFL